MKKLALAIGLGSYIVFGASGGTLASERADNTAGVAAVVDSRVAWSEIGTNARLLFLNQQLYPDTVASDIEASSCTDGACISR
jgi:hypothetical protein